MGESAGPVFVGRQREFALLDEEFSRVRESGSGRLLLISGRRQVGKSRLLTEWIDRQGAPAVFFTASRRTPAREVELFARDVADSQLPSAPAFAAGKPGDWDDALALLASTLDRGAAAVVVLDEFPYLVAGDSSVEATLQKRWDRSLSRLPVLLVLVGSDLGMMASLAAYDRPLYGRPSRELVVDPLNPADIAALLGLPAADALDAYLVVGGFPGVVTSWPPGTALPSFVERSLADPTSPLVVIGERSVATEFPADAQARRVLDVIGAGQRGFRTIADRAGVPDPSLKRALDLLVSKGVITVEEPVSIRPAPKQRRYRVSDPYLRFWLRFVGPQLPNLQRGRARLVLRRMWEGWDTYRGIAIEPLAREAVERLLPDPRFGDALLIGGWWARAHEHEVDLVGIADDRQPARVELVGSIKWRDRTTFSDADARRLALGAAAVPGVDASTRHVGISRAGFATTGLDAQLGPRDLLTAWTIDPQPALDPP
ncbi:MAG: ATP-binding protein [Egibacteraceae bacterium]